MHGIALQSYLIMTVTVVSVCHTAQCDCNKVDAIRSMRYAEVHRARAAQTRLRLYVARMIYYIMLRCGVLTCMFSSSTVSGGFNSNGQASVGGCIVTVALSVRNIQKGLMMWVCQYFLVNGVLATWVASC